MLALHLCHVVYNIITPEKRQTQTIVLGQGHPLHRFTGNKVGKYVRWQRNVLLEIDCI